MHLRLKRDQVVEGELLASWIDDGMLLVHSSSGKQEQLLGPFDIPNLSEPWIKQLSR